MATFTNQAQLSYNNSVKNSNIAVGEIQEVLSATKNAVSSNYHGGHDVTYAISIVNSGNTAFNGITVTDNLGTYAWNATTLTPLDYVAGTLKYYIGGVLQPTPSITSNGGKLIVSGINLPPETTAMLLYEAVVNQYAPLTAANPAMSTPASTITNTATITGTGFTTLQVSETLSVAEEPNLSITKSVSPIPVAENGTLTYTFVIQNTGNKAATDADLAAIKDIFKPILGNLTASFNGTKWTEGTEYDYDETTGTFTSTPGQITVPPAAYTQDTTGAWVVSPGVSTLIITGTVQ